MNTEAMAAPELKANTRKEEKAYAPMMPEAN
jgi:hypothetical protein